MIIAISCPVKNDWMIYLFLLFSCIRIYTLPFLLLPHFFHILFVYALRCHNLPGYRGYYSYSLQTERSGDRKPVVARFSLPVHTDTDTHTASCAICTEAAGL